LLYLGSDDRTILEQMENYNDKNANKP